jgi:HAD superfamily hydrolase (TIGR01509 family)
MNMTDLNRYALVIFDCDGTLVDSERLSNALVTNMMRELGISIDEERCLQLFKGTHFGKILQYVEDNAAVLPEFDFESEFRKRCKIAFESSLMEVKGASQFIRDLNIPYCVASNGPRIKMETSLGVTGLKELIPEAHIFSAYDIGIFKPEPDLFRHAADYFGVVHTQALVIEDTLPGIEAAYSAGMDVWAVHHKGLNDEVTQMGIPYFENYESLKFEDV